jgi:hypothetical protein
MLVLLVLLDFGADAVLKEEGSEGVAICCVVKSVDGSVVDVGKEAYELVSRIGSLEVSVCSDDGVDDGIVEGEGCDVEAASVGAVLELGTAASPMFDYLLLGHPCRVAGALATVPCYPSGFNNSAGPTLQPSALRHCRQPGSGDTEARIAGAKTAAAITATIIGKATLLVVPGVKVAVKFASVGVILPELLWGD